MSNEDGWVRTTVDDGGTINDGGVKIDLASYDDVEHVESMATKYPSQVRETEVGKRIATRNLHIKQTHRDFDSLDLPMDFEGMKDHLTTHVAGSVCSSLFHKISFLFFSCFLSFFFLSCSR
jgi:hypothetical protein